MVVFFGVYTGRDPRLTDVMVILIASFAMAIASYTLVEQPIRTVRWFKADGRMLVAALVAMVLVAGLTLTLPWRVQGTIDRWDTNAQVAASAADQTIPEGIERDFAPFVDGSTAISPNPIKAAEDKDAAINACQAAQRDTVTSTCEFGETENPKATVAIVGDSHAAMFSAPIITIAEERDWRVVTYLHSACPFSADRRTGDTPEVEACVTANAQTRAEVLELAPQLVITAFQESYALAPRGSEEHPGAEGLAEVWNECSTTAPRSSRCRTPRTRGTTSSSASPRTTPIRRSATSRGRTPWAAATPSRPRSSWRRV